MSTSNYNTALRLRRQPSPHPPHTSFTNFKLWIKGAILRNQREKQPILSTPSPIERTLRRLPSVQKRVPSKRSSANIKRRKSIRSHQPSPNRSSKLFNLNYNLNSNNSNNNNDNANKNSTIINKKKDVNNNDHLDNDGWVDEEILKNEDELIISNINPALSGSDVCETSTASTTSTTSTSTTSTVSTISTVSTVSTVSNMSTVSTVSTMSTISTITSNSPPISVRDLQQSQFFCDPFNDSKDDFLENTRIIKGSVEHFAYVRTLRKLRGKDRQRITILQCLLLNNILTYLSNSQLPDEIRKSLIYYKNRVYELNRIKRNSINNHDQSPYSTLNDSTSSLCPSSMVNKRLSSILAEIHPISPITLKYRASYASTKVVMVFDEESDQLVVKDLPMARRRRRLSDISNTLSRSTTSSTTSTNSSQSSLVTLTDDVDQQKYSPLTTKEPDSYLSNLVVIRDDDDDDDDEEDNVPLFVLKEQFRYSGRSYYLNNNISNVRESGPSRVTLAV